MIFKKFEERFWLTKMSYRCIFLRQQSEKIPRKGLGITKIKLK